MKLKFDLKNKSFFVGIAFLNAAFLCLLALFYLLGHNNMKSKEEIELLQEQMTLLEIDKSNTELELTDTKSRLNKIDMNYVLEKANEMYPPDEKNRREGLLWKDKNTSMYIVTLGALNGLRPGSFLSVYDGEEKIGEVVVDTPLDVISYVQPISESLQQSENNYYRVVID